MPYKKPLKQSMNLAIFEALEMSKVHPDITYVILDKPRKRTIVLSVDYLIREAILDGWRTFATVKDGLIRRA